LPAAGDLAAQATLVAIELRGCPRSIINAAKLINRVYDNYGPEEQRRFPTYLAERRVIPLAEAKMGRFGDTMRKLLVLAEHVELLEQPELAEYLPPGYSPLYHLVLLHNALPESSAAQRLKRLAAILAAAKGAITRKWLIDAKRELTQKDKPPGDNDNEEPTSPAAASSDMPTGQTQAEQGKAEGTFNLNLFTPGKRDFSWLGEEYLPNYLASCLPLLGRIDEAGACIVIAARVSDLPEVFKLLRLCGVKRPSRILFPRSSDCVDGTDDEVIVVAKRGEARFVPIADQKWPADAGRIDVNKIAERLCPDAKRRAHFFAEAQTDGWISFNSHSTWAMEPTLKERLK
jgi:hypothetical protein